MSRLLAFGFGFITASLLVLAVLLLSRAEGGAYQFDRIEAMLSDGRMSTTQEFTSPAAKPKTVWNSQVSKDTAFVVFRFAPRNVEQELWLYVHTAKDRSEDRLFGAMRLDRASGAFKWLALDPAVMNEFMTHQASQLLR